MAEKLRQTMMRGSLTGVLSEKALSIVHGKVKDENGKETIEADIVRGTIAVETDTGTFQARIYTQSKKSNGEDNSMYKGLETIVKEYVSKAELVCGKIKYKTGEKSKKDSELKEVCIDTEATEASVVTVPIQIACNDYVAKDGNVKSGVQLSFSKANRVSGEYETSSDCVIEGVITAIKPEVDKEEDETGRLIVEIMGVDYYENAQPFTLIVDEELADDFEETFNVNDTTSLDCELTMRRVGGKTTQTRAHGRAAKVSSGFDVMEIQVVGFDEPFSDDDDIEDEDGNVKSKVFTKKEIKKLKDDREIMLENLKNKEDKKEKSDKPKSGLKGRKAKVEEDLDIDDDGELPF